MVGPKCHAFLCQEKTVVYRMFTEGNKDEIEKYLQKHFDATYLGEFVSPLKSDIDSGVGLGNRKIDGGEIKTCKFMFDVLSVASPSKYFENILKNSEKLRVEQEMQSGEN